LLAFIAGLLCFLLRFAGGDALLCFTAMRSKASEAKKQKHGIASGEAKQKTKAKGVAHRLRLF
jgi:hypothetical protein